MQFPFQVISGNFRQGQSPRTKKTFNSQKEKADCPHYKPMVLNAGCLRENNGNPKNDENDVEDNSDSSKQDVKCLVGKSRKPRK